MPDTTLQIMAKLLLIKERARMRIKTLLGFLTGLLFLTGCNRNTDESLSLGFNQVTRENCITLWISVGLKCKKDQSFLSTFDVYFGAYRGLTEKWKNDELECSKPDDASFAMRRDVMEANKNILKTSFKVIADFPNDEKYAFSPKSIEGTMDGYIPDYNYYYQDEIDFSALPKSSTKGYIRYYMTCYDAKRNSEIEVRNLANVGSGLLHFEVRGDNSVIFIEEWKMHGQTVYGGN
jgi:hypothetical protein